MDENDRLRRVIIISLAGLLIGSLLFIFGLSIQDSIWPMLVNYIVAMVLYICSFLAVYNNHRPSPQTIFKYLMCLSLFMIVFISIVIVIQLL